MERMMKIVIRDDDLCYYSRFSDFLNVYEKLNIPVSISLVPFGVSDHADKRPFFVEGGDAKSVEFNFDLCNQLRAGIKQKKYEIMLHGFTHEYKEENGRYIPEMVWRSKEESDKFFNVSLLLFERVFNIRPAVFISPSDKCKKSLFPLLKKYKLNYCGLIDKLTSRPFSYKTFRNYLRRQFSRIKYGYPYCGVMKYSGWKEIQTFQKLDFEYLISVFTKYKKMGSPMVIETHYWHLRDNPAEYKKLEMFINWAKNNGAEFTFMSDIFD